MIDVSCAYRGRGGGGWGGGGGGGGGASSQTLTVGWGVRQENRWSWLAFITVKKWSVRPDLDSVLGSWARDQMESSDLC